ncbi:FtsK/SpoIIIE domain-containing protein [Streptomyces cremeus]
MTGGQIVSLIGLVLIVVGLGVLRWRRPAWYWLGFGALVALIRIRISFRSVMEACGLTEPPSRSRLWIAAATHREPVRMMPGIRWVRIIRSGLVLRLRMRPGQEVQDFEATTERLRHSWRMHGVHVHALKPGYLEIRLIGYDVLRKVVMPGEPGAGLLRVPVALRADGSAHLRDFRATPHELVVGATESGKSVYLRGLIKGLAPQQVALVGIDCKWGVELAPFARRLSALAVTPDEAGALLDALVGEMTSRFELVCAAQNLPPDAPLDAITSDIWGLPEDIRPVPLVVVVDEIAELFLLTNKADEKRRDHLVTQLIRLAQLGRAAGVYLEICGQRFGSELGPGATSLRAQLTGRVAHRVNDEGSAKMALGDVSPRAVGVVTAIAPTRPGTAVTALPTGGFARIRAPFTSLPDAVAVCAKYAHMTPDLPALDAFRPVPAPAGDLVELAPEPA